MVIFLEGSIATILETLLVSILHIVISKDSKSSNSVNGELSNYEQHTIIVTDWFGFWENPLKI